MKKFILTSLNEYLNNINIKHYSGIDFVKVYNQKIEEINNFKYFNNRSDFNEINNVYFFVLQINEKIIGLAHIRKSPYIEDTYWLSYLTILNDYENMKYASKLSEYIFQWFSKNNLQFETSSYSEKGFLKLKPLFNRLSKKYNVSFIDKNSKI